LHGTVEVVGFFDVAATKVNFIMSGVAPNTAGLAALNASIAPATIAALVF